MESWSAKSSQTLKLNCFTLGTDMRNLKSTLKAIVPVLALGIYSPFSHAATVSDTFEVRVNVAEVCEVTANDLDFGTYDPLDALPLVSGIATIDVTCALLTPHNVGIDAGQNGTGVADRKMIIDGAGTDTLDYTLGCAINLPPAGAVLTNCLTNWGNTIGTDTFVGLGIGIPIPIIMTGTIPAGQNVPIGAYRDNPVTATVTF
jgi:spore coat protein U-like protein